jgi:saccharopine dehydrogenase-like NADP-dependent oxidoreductase
LKNLLKIPGGIMAQSNSIGKKVLILGAGLVTRPIVAYLLDHKINVTVASRTVSKAQNLINGHSLGRALAFNINDSHALEKLVSEHDLTVSLLPANYHVEVAKACIKHKKDMVTSSYVSPAMKSLHEDAQNAGIIILNELGLDPGIDHMSAMRIINDVKAKGGRVTSFCSYCGGLPAPEANDNPWGYKFSWAPRGVLVAATNAAKYQREGQLIDVAPRDLFLHKGELTIDGIDVESYPNRDSMGYISLYGLEGVKTMFRATLRYPSHCDAWYKLVNSGFLDLSRDLDVKGGTCKDFAGLVLNCDPSLAREELIKKFSITQDDPFIKRLDFIGLFSDAPLRLKSGPALDILADILMEKLVYKENERDMCILYHEFIAQYKDHKDKITSTLVDYGIPGGDSSMARGVSLPPAVGVRLILEGKINLKGVQIPVEPQIYEPVLNELESLDIICREESFRIRE